MFQDNTSTIKIIKIIKNGRRSAGKKTRHFDIRLFYTKDYVNRKEVTVECCPSEDMLANFMTKPLTGTSYKRNRAEIMKVTSLR